MMFLAKSFRELQYVDALVVLYARERLRAKPLLGEEIKSCSAHPIVHQRVGARVPGETRFQTFLENFVQLKLERVDMPNAWRARSHPLRLLFLELQEIEIESAVRNFFRAREPFFRNGEQRKPRWQRQRLLSTGQHHVDAERVHLDVQPRVRGDRIDDERGVRIR